MRPGLSGGQYRPLSDTDIQRIYETALDLLECVGIGDPLPEILHYALPRGCRVDDDNRLHFPRTLVEDLIGISAKEYTRYAPDPANDLEVRGTDVLFTTAGEAVTILDFETKKFRPTTLIDLYDATRLADQLEHIHIVRHQHQSMINSKWIDGIVPAYKWTKNGRSRWTWSELN